MAFAPGAGRLDRTMRDVSHIANVNAAYNYENHSVKCCLGLQVVLRRLRISLQGPAGPA
ncbi:hypothetical protein PCAR4_200212 [Paraburkholderia caribensis]|nr:hypothetical protein PCAR4_200212 [Paraburkholderia caribensis]